MSATDTGSDRSAEQGSIKETLISLVISFVMALVFRSFVVEAFIIPTGSMAPTLLGAHMHFRSPQSGFEWEVNPWYDLSSPSGIPAPIQGAGPHGAPSVTDPVSTGRFNPLPTGGRRGPVHGFVTVPQAQTLRAGDRILVEKYLYELFPPRRFDVVVFKNPEDASQNFIKRLVGLPNEEVWIADGDVFTRPIRQDETGELTSVGEWRIARKPERVQQAVWWPLYSSEFAPLDPVRDGRRWFQAPWRAEGWQIEDRRVYRRDSAEPSDVVWDTELWPVTNWTPYNETPVRLSHQGAMWVFPVADLRMSAEVRPDAPGLSLAATITSHGHEFRAVLRDGQAALQMRPLDVEPSHPWTELAAGPATPLAPGRATQVEFLRVDQAMELRIDGKRVLRAEYDWGPSERLRYATGTPGEEFTGRTRSTNLLIQPDTYVHSRPSIRWSFSGSPLSLARVGLYRDLFYEPAQFGLGGPGLATHPHETAKLGPDQFFVLGDNSPSSKDGRLWDQIDEDVAAQIDPTVGVVPRELMLGKAFFVYFPAPFSAGGRIPVPNLGKVRFID